MKRTVVLIVALVGLSLLAMFDCYGLTKCFEAVATPGDFLALGGIFGAMALVGVNALAVYAVMRRARKP